VSAAVLRSAWRALGGFLRGFVGVTDAAAGCSHDHPHHNDEPGTHPCATPESVRQALAARAATRGTCC